MPKLIGGILNIFFMVKCEWGKYTAVKAIKPLLVGAGFLAVAIGTVGIFLPILPTVPFYLLASFCFAKGSTRFLRWFTSTKLYKKHFASFTENRSMTLQTKLSILIPVSLMLILACLTIDLLVMRITITVLLLLKYWFFIFKIRTISDRKSVV